MPGSDNSSGPAKPGLPGTSLHLSGGGGPRPARRLACLTFDDGFADFAELALPLLSAARMAATLYVPTAFVGGCARWLAGEGGGDRPMLSWEQIAAVAGAGVECGAHSHTHAALDLLGPAELEDEVRRSRGLLEDRLGRAVESFCYPFGYHRPRVRQAVRDAGFSSACAVGYRRQRPDGDPFAIQRLLPTAGMGARELLDLLEGRGPRLGPALRRAATPGWRALRGARRRVRRAAGGGG